MQRLLPIKFLRIVLILVCCITQSIATYAQSWQPLGPDDFNLPSFVGEEYNSLAIDGRGTLYIAYMDNANNLKATVKKFNGSNWEYIGSPGFSGNTANYLSLAVDSNGTPYLAYPDGSKSSKATVKKFNGTSWVDVGTAGFSNARVSDISLSINKNGTPFIAYSDHLTGKNAVMQFNGSSWIYVGKTKVSTGTPEFNTLAIDSSGTPFIAYNDYHFDRAIVKKFSGGNWLDVGTPGFSNSSVNNITVAIGSNNTPYVAYEDNLNNGRPTVKKFNGSTWEWQPSISAFEAEHITIAIDGNSIPYIAFFDRGSYFVTVKKLIGGNWVYVGNPADLGENEDGSISLAIDKSGTPYVAYQGYNGIANVKKFNGTKWVSVGNPYFSAGSANYLSLAIDNTGIPYVAYQDDYFIASNKAAVMKFNGTNWVNVGSPGFSVSSVSHTTIAIDGNDIPYISYKRVDSLIVKKFNGSSWINVGGPNVFPGRTTGSANLVFDSNATPYIAYSAYIGYSDANNSKATIKKFNGSTWENVGTPSVSAKAASPHLALKGGNLYIAYSSPDAFAKSYPLTSPPTNISLSATTINENVAANSIVGTLTSTDADTSETHSYSLVTGSGDTDNTAFNISGNTLRLNFSPDYEVKNNYSIRIRTTDTNSLTFEKTFTITINDIADIFTWTGSVSTAWGTAGNWSTGSPPTASDDVNIPAGVSRFPEISSDTASAKDLTIAAGASLTLSGGILQVKEDFTNNGNFTATGGSASFSGATMQVIGGANPSTFNDLTISAAGAALAGPVLVQHLVTLNGDLNTNGNTFTLISDTSGTAMVVNSGGVVNGTATMQRYIDPTVNSGLGYRHYASPVSNTTISDLATSGFTSKVNTAYNALPTPSLSTANFPTVFAYNESRISGSYPGFGIGWESPAALTDALVPGKGYTVNLGANQTVDLVGTLNNGTVTLTNLNTGGLANSGWHLLGNPYPAPINWNNIAKPSGMMDAVYAYRSSTTYGGSYASYVNGVGTLTGGIIPAMQAFFVRTTANVPSFSFTNAARLTTYDNPSFYRTTEIRPLLQLSLSNAQSLKDETFVYLENGATSGLDGAFDALEMPMGTVRIFTLAGNEALSINGLAPVTTAQQIPVVVEGVAGTYTLKAEQFLNLQGYDVKLEDKQLSSMQPLQLNSLYNFSHSGGQSNNRFVLHLNAKVTGMANAEKGMGLEVYPNPNRGKFKLKISGINQDEATMLVTDLVGREIMQQDLKGINGNMEAEIALPVNKGIYLLQVKTGEQVIIRKIVVE